MLVKRALIFRDKCMYRNVTLLTLPFIISGCAMMKDFAQSTMATPSTITLTRNIEQPMLGSTTYVYEVSEGRGCYSGADGPKKDTRFMTIDDGNPLISDFNLNGVKVDPGKSISLYLYTVAGPQFQCPVVVSFTPEQGKNYQVKLLGRVSSNPHNCRAELWSSENDTNKRGQEKFDKYDDCRPG